MKLKTVAEHYDAVKPELLCCHDMRDTEAKKQTERLVRSVRDEIAGILCGLMDLDNWGLPDALDHVRELAKLASQNPAAVAVETEDERNGRLQYERFWAITKVCDWASAFQEERDRWIAYAKTIQRPKMSPGQRLFEAMNKAYGWGILWSDCPVQQKLEAAAKSLGITECDA